MIDTTILFEIFERTANIYIGVLLGWLFIKSPLKKYRKAFTSIAINIFMPILIIISLIGINFGDYWAIPLVASLLVSIIGIIAPRSLAKLLRQEQPDPAELCTASFPNALNFPYPIIFSYSQEALGYAGIFLAIQIVLRNTLGLSISGVNFMDRKNLIQVLKFPPTIAIIIGFILRAFVNDSITSFVATDTVQFIFQMGIYATLMTVGFSIKKPDLDFKIPIFRSSVSRFVISLGMGVLIIVLINPIAIVALPLIVQSMAPPAVNNALYAEEFNLNTELTSQIIVALTLIALIILPLELYILQIIYF